MEAAILINRAFAETRVALLEDGAVAEIYVERDHEQGLVGNIYKGRVTRVLPGMQAAFVDIGLDRAAFLYVDDVLSPERPTAPRSEAEASDEPEEEDPDAALTGPANAADLTSRPAEAAAQDLTAQPARPASYLEMGPNTGEFVVPKTADVSSEQPSIADLIHEGQEIVCQVSKDPLGSKGARVTTYVTLPGRYVVYMPTTDHVGISKRITDEAERKRLRTLVESMRDGKAGFIVRTEGSGLDEAKLREDMDFLRSLWSEVEDRGRVLSAPAQLQPDLDLVLRATRDLFTREVERLIVDDEREFRRIKDFLQKFAPHLVDRIELFQDQVPLFDHYGVEAELERALQRKVAMKSGASIVIDQAEALTAIDVNTGRFVGKQNLESTILRTNLEAVREVVAQLRLRNIGGIIVVDFIDMESQENRERVFGAFVEELKRDRAKTHVLPISGLGVIEMTRKRVRESLGRRLTEPCPYCEGRGRIRSRVTICHDIFRELARQSRRHYGHDLVVSANPEIAAMLTEDNGEKLSSLESQIGLPIVIEARSDFHHERFQIHVRGHGRGP
jgi:ribonuclease G